MLVVPLATNVVGNVVVVVGGGWLFAPWCGEVVVVDAFGCGWRLWAPAMARPVTAAMTTAAAASGAPRRRGRRLMCAMARSRRRWPARRLLVGGSTPMPWNSPGLRAGRGGSSGRAGRSTAGEPEDPMIRTLLPVSERERTSSRVVRVRRYPSTECRRSPPRRRSATSTTKLTTTKDPAA